MSPSYCELVVPGAAAVKRFVSLLHRRRRRSARCRGGQLGPVARDRPVARQSRSVPPTRRWRRWATRSGDACGSSWKWFGPAIWTDD